MENKNENVRLELTPEQRQQVADATGKDVKAVELDLSAKELEERIAPAVNAYLYFGN